MRKTVIGAATIALLSTTALVSAQQMQEPKGQPSAKEQGPASDGQTKSDSGAQRAPQGAPRTEKSAEPRSNTGDKGKSAQGQGSDSDRKGRAEKSDSQQDRKGSAQKQTDQGKDRTAEPKSGDGAKGKTAEPKDKAGDSKSRTAEPKDRAGDRNKDAARDRDEPGKQRDQAQQGKGDKDGKDGKDGQRGDQARQGKDGKDGQRGDQARQGRDGQRDGDRANLSQDQRVQVRERLGRNREARRSNVSFSINIGTRVPRDFRLVVVPTEIVAIVPAYRGYRYFIVEERVVIVHPTRYEIVEVIEVDGPRRGGAVTASLDLSGPQTALILDRIPRDRHRADVSVDLALGAEVPSSVELYEFPADVIAEVPSIRQYRYVVLERRVLIVNPSGRDVVRVIDR